MLPEQSTTYTKNRPRAFTPKNDVCRHGGRHIAVEALRDAEIREVDASSDQRGIEFRGPKEMLQAVLHPVTLQRLPFVVSALEDLIGLALFETAARCRFGYGFDRKAFVRAT